MIRNNKFFVKKYDEDENKITLEEERKYHSPFVLFLIKNGRLLLAISLLLSVSVFIIAITLIFGNMKESSIVMYEQNGVVVSFDGDDNSIVNGTPITKEYAEKVFDSNLIQDNNLRGVVIKLKEVSIKDKNKGKVKGVITFYSDRTAIVKYDDGSYKRIYSVNGNYGITESGVIDSKAITNDLSGEYKKNDKYNINLIYLSDGSVIVIKDKVELFVRNSDITSNDDEFFTTLSGVSTPISKKGNKYTYSDGTIKENDWLPGAYYTFADGTTAKSMRFKLKSVKIGDKVVYDVTCSISNSLDAPMLLGQSVLSKFGSYTFDYKNGKLIIE